MPLIENGENPRTGLGGLDSLKAVKLAEINASFTEVEEDGSVMSSLGFEIDANVTANRNVEGLLTMLAATGEQETLFCDRNNVMHVVTRAQLGTIQLEIIGYGQHLYAQKWALRERVNAADTAETVNAIRWSEE